MSKSMSPEDAIAWLNTEDYESTGYNLAIGEAMQAIHRMIPMKPEFRDHGYKCPICCAWVWGFTDKRDFCGKCGQAIDWSEHIGSKNSKNDPE